MNDELRDKPGQGNSSTAATVPLSADEHLAVVRSAAQSFLTTVSAASDAGVSQALILPMLLEVLQESGVELDPRAMLGGLG